MSIFEFVIYLSLIFVAFLAALKGVYFIALILLAYVAIKAFSSSQEE